MSFDTDLDELLREAGEDDLGIVEFLDDFAAALTEGDGKAIAEKWETPGFVLSEDVAFPIENETQILELMAAARERYASRGVTNTKPQIVRIDEITDNIVCARVRWPWLDSEGIELGAETASYTLRTDRNGDWRIRIAILHGPEALS